LDKLVLILGQILNEKAPLRILDSTYLLVCQWRRMDSHKVAKGKAKMGKNWQGWHYGFKMHVSVDQKGNLCGIVFTPADVHDIHGMKYILNKYCKLAVGDTLYGAKVMGRIMYEKYGTVIIAPPHPKQRKKIATEWQHFLLHFRTKIEAVFDVLKDN